MSLKITSIIIINTFLLLSSCAIDWNDEKAKSIENLKQDLVTLQGQSHKTEELNKLELQDRCSKKSKEFFHDHYSNIKVSGYENHYNNKLNKCFIEIFFTQIFESVIWNNKIIYDSFEGKQFADYSWHTVEGKKYWEVEPYTCQVGTDVCHTTEEFDLKIKEFMEN